MRRSTSAPAKPEKRFQSTHPVRGATDCKTVPGSYNGISIHAPRAGCDLQNRRSRSGLIYFNPRTPCGVRPAITALYSSQQVFQSTHPVRGATPPCARTSIARTISIHAPRAGCDVNFGFLVVQPVISIHAPRAGCDAAKIIPNNIRQDFNPRTPCGVRLRNAQQRSGHSISIHAPRAGCDDPELDTFARTLNFNPRTPCGVRLEVSLLRESNSDISIHAPRAGCDFIRLIDWR